MPENPKLAHLALRVGLAFAFLYPAVAGFFDPISWASYFPAFVRTLPISTEVLLHLFDAFEVVLAGWILSGWKIQIPAALMALSLVAIVVFNTQDFEILFRDLAIAAMAIALILWPDAEPRAYTVYKPQ